MLSGGVLTEAQALMKSTVDNYCLKLKAYVDAITGPEEKKMQLSSLKPKKGKVKQVDK